MPTLCFSLMLYRNFYDQQTGHLLYLNVAKNCRYRLITINDTTIFFSSLLKALSRNHPPKNSSRRVRSLLFCNQLLRVTFRIFLSLSLALSLPRLFKVSSTTTVETMAQFASGLFFRIFLVRSGTIL